ncbi:MAG: hypothetical protein US49_C0002G0163 [candidate division TM6 bacterium GW2011_GWF2_37_49]|nr:MAG: hypothetical protein US49_C0002G0163 [candidate division TM6 bacterium GW2011_GWF2_37_49]
MICRLGSALLLILGIIFVLLSASMKCWKISSFRMDIQSQREIYYKRFCLTDNLLNILIDRTVNEFNQIFNAQESVKIDLSEYVKDSGYSAFGHVSTVRIKNKVTPNELAIAASLVDGQGVVFTLRCLLSKKRIVGRAKQSFIISGFTIF